MTFEERNLLAAVGVPDAGGAVGRRRHRALAVGVEIRAPHRAGMGAIATAMAVGIDHGERGLCPCASSDGTARLWDAPTGQPIGEPLAGDTGAVVSGAFSPDGARIVTTSGNAAWLWDAATGRLIGKPLVASQNPDVVSVAFSSDSAHIVSVSDRTALGRRDRPANRRAARSRSYRRP
jgi:hypothetical protein